jgi:hypothetical protein
VGARETAFEANFGANRAERIHILQAFAGTASKKRQMSGCQKLYLLAAAFFHRTKPYLDNI